MKKLLRGFMWTGTVLFVLVNIMAFFYAWKFTHFDPDITVRKDPATVPFMEKMGILFTGVNLPRPLSQRKPERPYEVLYLQSNKKMMCWSMKTGNARGTVVLFRGYGGEKSSMLDKAYILLDAGYNVLLPDFMGAGGSEGN